jgi:hypothetical protein
MEELLQVEAGIGIARAQRHRYLNAIRDLPDPAMLPLYRQTRQSKSARNASLIR